MVGRAVLCSAEEVEPGFTAVNDCFSTKAAKEASVACLVGLEPEKRFKAHIQGFCLGL